MPHVPKWEHASLSTGGFYRKKTSYIRIRKGRVARKQRLSRQIHVFFINAFTNEIHIHNFTGKFIAKAYFPTDDQFMLLNGTQVFEKGRADAAQGRRLKAAIAFSKARCKRGCKVLKDVRRAWL